MASDPQWDWWREALQATEAGREITKENNNPQSGFYESRRKRRNGDVIRRVVAVWRDAHGALFAKCDNEMLDADVLNEMWPWLRPMPKPLYDAIRRGGPWPDLNEAVTNHNRAPQDDSFEGIRDAIDSLAVEAERLIKKGAAKTQDDADQAADLADRLSKLRSKADAARETEKRPYLEQGRAVDARWKPVITAADIYQRLKQIVCLPFLSAKKKAEETARAKAVVTGERVPERTSVTAGGTRGRAIGLRTIIKAQIVDQDALYQACRNSPKIVGVLQELADAAARCGTALPGTKLVESEQAA